jgi:hypothetical protein
LDQHLLFFHSERSRSREPARQCVAHRTPVLITTRNVNPVTNGHDTPALAAMPIADSYAASSRKWRRRWTARSGTSWLLRGSSSDRPSPLYGTRARLPIARCVPLSHRDGEQQRLPALCSSPSRLNLRAAAWRSGAFATAVPSVSFPRCARDSWTSTVSDRAATR